MQQNGAIVAAAAAAAQLAAAILACHRLPLQEHKHGPQIQQLNRQLSASMKLTASQGSEEARGAGNNCYGPHEKNKDAAGTLKKVVA